MNNIKIKEVYLGRMKIFKLIEAVHLPKSLDRPFKTFSVSMHWQP
jgi:hypothetical protein